MVARKLGLVALIVSLMLVGAPRADAAIWTGSCALDVTFVFDRTVRATTTAVGYSIFTSPAADLDPLTSGAQPCVVDTSPLDPFRATSASGGGNAAAWNCESTVGLGSWDQSWEPDPPSVYGSHVIVGGGGHWTMEVNNPELNFTGVLELTLDASDATKPAQCATTGIGSLRMTGTMFFQDPAL